MSYGNTGLNLGPVVVMVCCLLVADAVLIGVHTIPGCVGKVSWAVMPPEALLMELVSVSLLVIATASILIFVKGLLGLLTELAIAYILITYNTSLVHLVRCLCVIPGRCMWLTALVLPLLLLSVFVMCWDTMGVRTMPA